MASEVATKKNAELSTDLMDDILEFAGEGAAFGADEMQIPFIRALQALSPQLNKKKPEYIDGAEQGDLFNTVTGQVSAPIRILTNLHSLTCIEIFDEGDGVLNFLNNSEWMTWQKLLL